MKPNIIFIILDGCRWDRTNISSEFKELQSEGTFFNNVTAGIPYTVGAVNVILSGLYGKDNGIDAYYKVLDLKESIKVLPEIFQENGLDAYERSHLLTLDMKGKKNWISHFRVT